MDGSCTLSRQDIGGKAWGLNKMRALGLRVPPAIVATTQACREHHATGALPEQLWRQIVERMRVLEQATGRRFGATRRPLLVSVRSGAARSMPGMMETVLNLGINAAVEAALAEETGDPRHAAETHRRFVEQYRKVVHASLPEPVPADPWLQLRHAVGAVFDSWHSARAQVYRRNRGLSEEGCTAVTIQAMVFGNLDARSGAGVVFSRSPITGEAPAWGEWLARCQGEDVVSGRRTPEPLHALDLHLPQVYAELMQAAALLEADARDIQDIEFTVESGRLWLLQSRVAKRSPQAALRAAVAFAEEGLISKQEALQRVSVEQVRRLPRLRLAARAAEEPPAAAGQTGCPGVAAGVVVTDADAAQARARNGEDVILARPTTSPDDLHGIIAARGLVTEQGGSTSHAAVVSRELGRPCVVGCGPGRVTALAGQQVTLDGERGTVWAGNLTAEQSDTHNNADLRKLIEWGLPLTGTAEPMPTLRTASTAAAGDISELSLLRLVGLKGRANAALLADSLSLPPAAVAAAYATLCERGFCARVGDALRLTPTGQQRLASLLGEERVHADPTGVSALYQDFTVLDAELKRIMTAWQLRADGTPNDHRNAEYDAAVLERLAELHRRAGPLIQRMAAISPRLTGYGRRLDRAAERVAAGDHGYVAKIIADSYHTVWFELHEELLGLAGRTRSA